MFYLNLEFFKFGVCVWFSISRCLSTGCSLCGPGTKMADVIYTILLAVLLILSSYSCECLDSASTCTCMYVTTGLGHLHLPCHVMMYH